MTSILSVLVAAILSLFGARLPVEHPSLVVPSVTPSASLAAVAAAVLEANDTSSASSSNAASIQISASADNRPIIEQEIGYAPLANDYVTQGELQSELNLVTDSLRLLMNAPAATASPIAAIPETVLGDGNPDVPYAAENAIDNLNNVTITNANLTASEIPALDYLSLSGGTLTGALDVPSLAASSTNYGVLSATNASTSNFSNFGTAYFGSTATSTFDSAGDLTVAGNATLANATSTIFFATTASSTNLFAQTASLGVLTAGSLSLTNALPVTSGGTGWASFASGYIPFGNGASALATSSSLFWSNITNRLGIGTTSPAAPIELFGSDPSTNLVTGGGIFEAITNADQTAGNFDSLSYREVNSVGAEVTGTRVSGVFNSHVAGAESADLAFLTRNAGALSEKLRITGAGNVGIGTTSPFSTLSVVGNGYFSGALTMASLNAVNATSTNLFAATASSTNLFAQTASLGTLTVSGLSIVSGLGLAIGPGTISLVSGGSGYVLGDTVTLTCSGATFTTHPVVSITSVSAGAVTGSTLTNPGVATIVPTATCTLAQLTTSGTGSGASWTGTFSPIAGALSFAGLSTGGNVSNGNTFLGAETPSASGLGTAENTFVGDRAGGAFIYPAGANTAVGHDSCGIFGSTAPTGSFNVCLGDDAGRNISGAANDDTLLGQNAGRVVSGNGNTAVGESSLPAATSNNNTGLGYSAGNALSTGGRNTFLGQGAGQAVTSGGGNTIVGQSVGSLTLTSGNSNVIIGTGDSDACDVSTGGASDNLILCAGGGPLFSTSGGNTPSASKSTIAGSLAVGTTTPYARLTVWGPDTSGNTSSFVISNNASTTEFNVLDNGNATLAGTLTQNSDQRLKTNIQSLDASTSLSAIEALNPVTFNWIDPNKGTTVQLGFIAQQVLPIFPTLISTTSPTPLTPGGTLSLNYIGLISPIVSAIQELDEQLTTLGNTVANFANSFTTNELTFNRATGQELCLQQSNGTPVCVSGDQLAAVLAAANASQSSGQGSGASSDSGATATIDTPPIIQINGDNPAVVQAGATYNDLGATIIGPKTDINLGITSYVNGLEMSPVEIDTTAAATDTIDYVATDENGLTSTSTRTVIIEAPSIVPTQDASTTDATTIDQ